jgi:parallel beta-helix repeat protein
MTNADNVKNGSWKGTIAILLVAVMIAMCAAPLASAQQPVEQSIESAIVEPTPTEAALPDAVPHDEALEEQPDKSSFPMLTAGEGKTLNSATSMGTAQQGDHKPFRAPAPPIPESWTPLFYDDFEDGDFSDWTLVGANNDWQIGTPQGLGDDPTNAFQGMYSIGNDLTDDGEYEDNVGANTNYIVSPAIDCTGQTHIHLEFFRWLGIEDDIWDHASIQVSTDMVVWNVAWSHTGGTLTETAWDKNSYDISGWAGNQPTVYVRFDMGPTDASVTYCGWNIDNVYVGASSSGSILYSDDFEDGDFSDWTLGGGSNDWQIGTPSGLGGDPIGAFEGTHSIGNDLTGLGGFPGEYENNVPAGANYIYTPAINCAGQTSVALQFYRWLGVESATWDHAYIYISTDTITWNEVWSHTGPSFTDPAWTLMTYDISAWADNQPTVYIRFDMGPTDASVTYCGWNIDSISVYSGVTSISSCDLTPGAQTDYGEPGDEVTYLMTLENTGTEPATYDLSVSNNAWPTEFYDISFSGSSEDFSGAFPPAGWTTSGVATVPNGGGPTWWDLYNSYTYSAPGCAGLWWSNNLQDEWLITPEMDWSGVPSADITFWTLYNFEGAAYGWTNYHNTVEVSTDGGSTWTVIADLTQDPTYRLGGVAWGADWNAYEVPINLDLTAFAGEPSVQIAWHYWSDASGGYAIWMVDDIQLNAMSTSGIIDHIGPLNPGETRNFLVQVSIPPGANPGDLDVARIFANDETNPTVMDFSILTTMVAQQTPWQEDFEDPISSWTTWDSALGTEWEWGNPAGGTGPEAAASPDNCWGTNLLTDYVVPSEAILTSPAIQLGITDPVLIFDQWYEIDGSETSGGYEDGGWVELSDDGGLTWQQIFPNGDYNDWTGDTPPGYGSDVECYAGISDGWETAAFDLNAWAGEVVYLRFRFFTEQWVESNDLAGWYIDNVYVGQYPYGVDLQPGMQYQAENTGTDVYYWFTVYNTGIWEDTYDLYTGPWNWPTTIWDETGSYQIDEIGPIAPGENMNFLVIVHIPAGLPPGVQDWVEIFAQSHGDPSLSDSSLIGTEADPWFWFDVGPDTQTNFGWEGEWVSHSVWITNEGSRPDVYLPMFYENSGPEWNADWWTQFYTVDLRPQGIYNGIDDGSQTWWWGPVMPGETKEYIVKVFVPTDDIGAFDQARISITSDNDGMVVRNIEIWTRLSMPAPFYDDFETAGDEDVFGLYNDGGPLGDIYGAWQADDYDHVGVNDDTSYSGGYSMFTDGGEVIIESCKINMDMPRGIATCVIQRGDDAFSENPDYGEDLIVEYSDGNLQWAQWHQLAWYPGDGMEGELFTPLWVLPQDALTPRFQIRFRQTDGSGIDFDYWHIDDVFVGAPESWAELNPGMTGYSQMTGPGYIATYNIELTNLARHCDEYQIFFEGNEWPTWATDWWVGPLGPEGEPEDTVDITIIVEVPADAVPGTTETATLIARSVANPDYYETITLRTTVGRVTNLDQDSWYLTLQSAIDDANPGEHIHALPGLYYEDITVDIPLTITGEDRETTIITNDLSTPTTNTGIYFVTNCIPDYGMGNGQDSRWIIENTFDWLWPTHANSGDILLVWDNIAWSDSWKTEMNSRSIGWTEQRGDTLTAADLDATMYPLVIITEYMDSSSLDNMETLVSALENYVNAGGVLVDMLGTNNVMRWSRGVPGPFGVESFFSNYDDWNYIVEPTHPMVQGMSTPTFDGSSASHGRMSVAPMGSSVIITSGNVPGGDPVACWLDGDEETFKDAKVNISSNNVFFSEFTVENAPVTGILLDSVSGCDIGNNIIQNCGGGISLDDSGANYIHDNVISNNVGDTPTPSNIETMFASNNWYAGNMFDVEIKVPQMKITSFDVNVNNPGTVVTFALYYREGTYVGFTTIPAAWTLAGTGTATSMGLDIPTNIDIPDIILNQGTYGFYVYQTSYPAAWTQYTNGNNVYENDDIKITTGIGGSSPIFSGGAASRTWNGRIHYTAIPSGVGIKVTDFGFSSFQDDFSIDTGLWTYYGNALRTGGYCRLTQNANGLVGRALYNQPIQSAFIAEFDFLAGGGNGADGMAMNFFKEAYTPAAGGLLGCVDGDQTTLGYSVEFDNYYNGGGDPSANHIAITQNHFLNHLASVNDARTEDNIWHHAKVVVIGTSITVYVDDMATPLLSWNGVVDMTYGGFSFSAGTGGLNNNHFVDNIRVYFGNIIESNNVYDNEVGILLWNGADNQIFHNNLVNNGVHAIDDRNTNHWDGGYPTGGNYWSGFSGPDTKNGPLQNIAGADGIIDNPYIIDADSQDNYPLRAQYTTMGIVIPIDVVEEIIVVPETETGGGGTSTSTAGNPVELPIEVPAGYPAGNLVAPVPDEPAAAEPVTEVAEPEVAVVETANTPVEPALNEQATVATGTGFGYMPMLIALVAIALMVSGFLVYRRKR